MFNELGNRRTARCAITVDAVCSPCWAWRGHRDRVLLLAYGTGFERGLMIAFETFVETSSPFSRTHFAAGRWHQSWCRSQAERAGSGLPASRSPLHQEAVAEVNKQSLVAYGTRSASYDVRHLCQLSENSTRRCRRRIFFGEQEDFTHSRVAVLGYDVKKKLFSGQNAIGENVRIEGVSYVIVGVMKHMIPMATTT